MKTPGASAQLTIFYDGSVNVYDEVTPDKAQDIMFIASRSATRFATYPLMRPPLRPQPAGSPVMGPPRPQGSQLEYPLRRPPHPQLMGSPSTRPQQPQVGSPLMRQPLRQLGSPLTRPQHKQLGSSSGAAPPLLTQLLTRHNISTRSPSKQQNLEGSNNLRSHSLPLARAYSLKRFLEARQGRIVNKAPSDSRKKFDLNAKPGP